MDAIKTYLILFIFIPFLAAGQKTKYPKDTIYLMYKDTTFSNYKMKSKENYIFKGKKGIKFWWKNKWLFYNQEQKADTFCTFHLKDYEISDLKEIRKKEINWVDRKFKGQKYKPYSGSKNAVFHTYLIEVISKDYFVIYPVSWPGEGVID